MEFLILLSPSKTQTPDRKTSAPSTIAFAEKTRELVTYFQGLSVDEIAAQMKISDRLAVSTQQRFRDLTFPIPADTKGAGEALATFKGDVFSEIQVEKFTDEDFQYAQHHLRILSGLYGILRPLDLIQSYRLEMGQKISAGFTSTLYQFWKEEITSSIQKSLATLEDSYLLNLASDEYFKALDAKRISSPIIQVMFQQEKNGKRRTIAIHAKRARGALANYILRNRVNSLQDIREFSYQGYRFETSLSTDERLFFLKQV